MNNYRKKLDEIKDIEEENARLANKIMLHEEKGIGLLEDLLAEGELRKVRTITDDFIIHNHPDRPY